MRAYDPFTAADKRGFLRAIDTLRKPRTPLHPLVRITLYVVLFWYVKDLVEQIIWSIT